MRFTRFLAGAVAATVLATPVWAQEPRGPKVKEPFRINPDTVYFNKTGNETTLVRTVSLHRVGPPGQTIRFDAVASADSVVNWLGVSPNSGTVPAELTLTATLGSLGPGVHTGKVTVTPKDGAGSPQTVNVILRVLTGPGGTPAAFVRPPSLSFHMTQGGANPEPRRLHVSSPTGGASITWNATPTITTPSGGTWLIVAPMQGTGPGVITVSVNGAGLAPGSYNGYITVAGQKVPVTLEVRASAPAHLVIDPRAFNFIVHPDGPAPARKILRIKNTGSGTLNWTAKATSTGNWLLINGTVNPISGVTPATIELSVTPGSLARGHYAGTVQVTAGERTETARVFLRLIGPPSPAPVPTTSVSAIQITPSAVEFCFCGGVLTPPSAAVQLTSRLAGLSFAASASAQGGNWLNVTPKAGPIPGIITLTATSSGLAAGIYTGVISLHITGAVSEQRGVPVTLRVSPLAEVPRLEVRPGAIAFQAVQGRSNPAPQQVNVATLGAASIPFKATTSTTTAVNWLSAAPSTGTAPATVAVSADIRGVAAGVYLGTVVFQSTGAPGALPATLNVFLQVLAPPASAASNVHSAAAEPAGLLGFFVEPPAEFMATAGSPQAVLVALRSADGKAVEGATVEIAPSSGEPAFMLEDAGGGLYTGMFRSLSAGPVSLTATAFVGGLSTSFGLGGDLEGGPAMPLIFSGGVVNAANYAPAPAPLAPGALVSLFGWNLADTSAAASALPLPRELAGVKVLVGGIEAPLLSVTAGAEFDQINLQVPVEAAAFSYADVVVLSSGAFSAPEGISIAPAVPALFTRDRQGTGAVAALHADYTEITPERPARPGETVLLYATGLGEVSPAQVSGQAPTALSRLVAPVQVLIAGRAARADFAGLAPSYAGLYQLNVIVPEGTPPGDAAIEILVDGIGSGQGVIIPIR